LIDFIYISVIGISFIVGLLFFKRTSPLWNILLLPFLFITFANETLCYFLKNNLINTTLSYNLYYYFRFPLLGFVYYDAMNRNRLSSLILRWFLVVSAFFFVFNIYTYKTLFKLQTNYLLAGGLFIILFSLIYLYQLIKAEVLTNPIITPFFWVCMGFLLYFLGIIPFLGVLNILAKKSLVIAAQQFIISKSLSIVLYTLISFGFYLQWKQTK
jgi:hypothetical protein